MKNRIESYFEITIQREPHYLLRQRINDTKQNINFDLKLKEKWIKYWKESKDALIL